MAGQTSPCGCELEVTSFRTDFRAQQYLRTVSSSANQAAARSRSIIDMPSGTLRREYLHVRAVPAPVAAHGRFGADHQHFLRAMTGQVALSHSTRGSKFHQVALSPSNSDKYAPGRAYRERDLPHFYVRHNAGDFNSGLILRRQWQLNICSSRFGKPFTPLRVLRNSTGWYRGDPSASKPVPDGRSGHFAVAVCCLQQRLDILLADHPPSMFSSSLLSLLPASSMATRPQPDDNFSALQRIAQNRGKVRVQQTQTGEVAFHPQLFRVAVSSRTPGTCSASCSMA